LSNNVIFDTGRVLSDNEDRQKKTDELIVMFYTFTVTFFNPREKNTNEKCNKE
jgi:hypothetical protein